MVFRRFAVRLALRVAALFGLLTGLAVVVVETDFIAVAALIASAAIAQAWQVVRFVNRTNDELTRFLAAIRYDDFSQTFAIGRLGDSFADLNSAFEGVLSRFREARSAREAQERYLAALVDNVPVAIVAVQEDDRVELLNNSARRLLDSSGTTSIAALDVYGATFQRDVAQAKPGERKLTRVTIDGVDRHLILSTTQITVAGGCERVISLQDIQRELDATELSAWQDMVRMLSHEIGNSITPIASLARTAEDMIGTARTKTLDPAESADLLGDLGDAVDTIARRSEGLVRFVESYRQLTRLPLPQRREVSLPEYFKRLERLLASESKERGVRLHMGAPPAGMTISADESLLDQAILNVVRNAADAARSASEPQVWLDARLSDRGRPVIEIGDNGAGIDRALGEKIFLPFFTTKADGSGIGLSLARQVMLLHRGGISARERTGGGALFQLRF